MNLQMFLDLVVELRRQAHPAALASAELGLCYGHTGTAIEEHFVALQ